MKTARIELRTEFEREICDPFIKQPVRLEKLAISLAQAARDVATTMEIEEDPTNGTECYASSFHDIPVRRVQELWFAEKRKNNLERGCRPAAAGAHRLFLRRRALSPDEDVHTRRTQICVADGIDELKIQVLATVIGQFGSKVRGDQHSTFGAFAELIFDRRKSNNSVNGFHFRKQRQPLAVYPNLD